MNGGRRTEFLTYLRDTVLAKITVANGFNTTLKTIELGIRNPQDMNLDEFPAVFIAYCPERPVNISNKKFNSLLTVNFVLFVHAEETQSIQLKLNNLLEDVRSAVYEGPVLGGSDPSHGGLVAWTKWTGYDPDTVDLPPFGGATVEFEFSYTDIITNR